VAHESIGSGKTGIVEGTFEYSVRIVRLCGYLEKQKVPRALISQLLRAGTSVGANTTESQAGQSRADFLSKLCIALKECNESVYWLRLLAASDLVAESKLLDLLDAGKQIARILGRIIMSTKSNGVK
jgi:four helix bundle protein